MPGVEGSDRLPTSPNPLGPAHDALKPPRDREPSVGRQVRVQLRIAGTQPYLPRIGVMHLGPEADLSDTVQATEIAVSESPHVRREDATWRLALEGWLSGKTKGRGAPALLRCRQFRWSATVTRFDDALDLLGVVANTLQMRLNPCFDPLELFSQSLVHSLVDRSDLPDHSRA